MKLTIMLTIATILQISAATYSQNTKLTLNLKSVTISDVFKAIEEQSEFSIFFKDSQIDLKREISLNVKETPIKDILDKVFKGTDLSYKLLDKIIVVTDKNKLPIKISGTIISATDKLPIPGVNIREKGTNNITISDLNGQYSLEVSKADAILVCSFIGFETLEVTLDGKTTVDLTLKEKTEVLSDVVVVGYGVIKKSDLTGSVTSIRASDITNSKSVNVLQALQGKASGLDITQSSGQAGSSVNLVLRGNRSINASNSPLILVDGVEYGSNIDINSSDIESMEVLKDGASTAIYGTKGANGVILITTKKGGTGKTNITFNSYFSFNSAKYLPNIMNSQQFIQKRLETKIADDEITQYKAAGIAYNATTGAVAWNQTTYPNPTSVFGTSTVQKLISDYNTKYPTTPITSGNELITSDPTTLGLMNNNTSLNYLDMIFNNSVSQNYELGLSGGDDKTAINFSLGLMDDRGLLRNDQMRKYNIKLGVDHKVFKTVKVGANILFTTKKYNKRNSSIFNQALKTGTIGTLYDANGKYNKYPDPTFTFAQPNPMLDEVAGATVNEIYQNRVFGSAYLSWNLLKDLTFKSNFGVDVNFNKTGVYSAESSLAQLSLNKPLAEMTNFTSSGYTWDNTLTYQKSIGIHSFTLLAGSSLTANKNETYYMRGESQTTPSTEYYFWDGFATTSSTSLYSAKQMASFFGRVNYKLMEKYLFQATFRTDGSSVLAQGNQWYSFPSASVGWRVSEENFLKNANWLSNLKARFSWGKSGNAAIDPYKSVTLVGKIPIYSSLDNGIYSTYAPGQVGNPNLKWETTSTYDLGFDFGFLNNRISGTVDLYSSKTSDLIFDVPLPTTSVYPVMTANVAGSKSKGIELSLNTVNFRTNNFEWSTDWIFASNKEEITQLRENATELVYGKNNANNEMYRVGQPINCYYSFERLGIYSVQDLQTELEYVKTQTAAAATIDRGKIPMISNNFYPGDIKLKDVDNNGIFDDKDKKLYNENPKYTFSINNSFSYKTPIGEFGLSAQIIGRRGQFIDYDFYGAYKNGTQTAENGPNLDAWTPTNTGALFPRYTTMGNSATASYSNVYRYIDGSFIKIKDITLSYMVPKRFSNKVHISNFKLYASAKNMFTFSKVDNFDPETGGSMNFPLSKQIIFGVTLNF